MFCRNCGQEILPGDRFCGSCGTEVIVDPEYTYRERPEEKKPQQVQERPAEWTAEERQPETRSQVFPAEYRKYVGIAAALVALLGLFLPNIVVNDFGLSSYMGVSQPSYSYFSIMAESEVTFMSVLAVGSIVLVILFQAGNIPLASLTGCAGMLFSAYMITVAVDGSRGGVDYGVGFWLFLIAGFVCVFAAFFARRPKKSRS